MSSYVRFEKRTGDRPKLSELSPEIASIDGGRNLFQYFNDCFDTSGFEVVDSSAGSALAPIAGNGGVVQLTGDNDSGILNLPSQFVFSPTFVGSIKWSCRMRVVDSGSPAVNRVHVGLFTGGNNLTAADRSFIRLVNFNHGSNPTFAALLDFGQASALSNENAIGSFSPLTSSNLESFHVYSQEITFDGTNIRTLTSIDGVEVIDQVSTQADAGTSGMKWAIIGTNGSSVVNMLGMKIDLDWLSIVGTRDA